MRLIRILPILLFSVSAFGQEYQESGGIVSLEGENYQTNVCQVDGLGNPTTTCWGTVVDGLMSGGSAAKASSVSGIFTPPDSEYVSWNINTTSSSTWYIWVRARSFDSGTDSLFLEIDSLGEIQDNILTYGALDWYRTDYTSKGSIAAGTHTVTLHRRERLIEVDKVVLTTSGAYDPETVNGGLGPDESTLSGSGTNPNAPVLATIGNRQVNIGTTIEIDITATDADGDGIAITQSGKPSFCSFTDNGNGTADLDCSPVAGDEGATSITITATDDGTPAKSDEETFTLTHGETIAFPSAMGLGRFATGGRGGIVCHVDTTTNTSTGNQIGGSTHYRGSFKYCLDTLTVDRTIVFDVGGKITWSGSYGSSLAGDVTIACHTAPGADGIVLAGSGEMIIQKSNFIMRGCRMRSTAGSNSALRVGGKFPSTGQIEDVILDHVSVMWHGDETINFISGDASWNKYSCNATGQTGCPRNVTMQYSIVGLAGGDSSGSGNGWGGGSKNNLVYSFTNLSLIRNVWSNAGRRNPALYDGSGELINNVFYNNLGGEGPGFVYAFWDDSNWSLIGNGWYRGPMLASMGSFNYGAYGGAYTIRLFLQGNRHVTERSNDTKAETCILQQSGAEPSCSVSGLSKLSIQGSPPVTGSMSPTDARILTAEATLALLSADDGAVTNVGPFIPQYDFYDQYTVDGVKDIITEGTPANRTGDTQTTGGAIRPFTESEAISMASAISFASASRPAGFDSDWDGIPDTWEDTYPNILDKTDGTDGANIASNGYSHLENYINDLAGDTVNFDTGGGGPPPGGGNDLKMRSWRTLQQQHE